jgi:hypothetical protein
VQCPQCSTELPDDARFCGACGHRFDAAPAGAASPAAEPSAPAPPAAEPAAAAPAEAKEEGGQSFDLLPEDFERAFTRACDKAGIEPPAVETPRDHATLFAAAEAAGLEKLDVEKALHRISIEKLPASARRAMGVVLEDEVEPQGRPTWLPLVIGINVVALLIALAAWVLYDPAPERPPVELKPQKGEIDMSALETALDAYAEAAEGCYKAALEKNDKLAGDVTVTLRIGLDGKVDNPQVTKDDLKDNGALSCMVDAAKAQSFPAAQKAPVDVDVPLMFSAKEQ